MVRMLAYVINLYLGKTFDERSENKQKCLFLKMSDFHTEYISVNGRGNKL